MSNNKVYLAKNILASGLDVEYVKSHLSRIKGINIIENGMGFKPSECKAFVIVPDKDFDINDDCMVALSKNVAKDLKEFIKNNEEPDCAMNYVYVYTGQFESEEYGDAEQDYPVALMSYEGGFGIVDKDNFNHYAEIELGDVEDQSNLLDYISGDIDISETVWVSTSRHHIPSAEFALPPAPTYEERRLRNMGCSSAEEAYHLLRTSSCSNSGRRLLLRRRK